METKKRPHADDAEQSRAKKRAVSDDHASPSHPNGTTTSHGDEPKEGDDIELFRKEAIFRRMRYYSREAERSQARVEDLERRFNTCQAGLAALEACWTQLIGTIRSLVKPEDLPSLEKESEGVHDLAAHLSSEADPEYVEALRDKMQTTSDIIKAFVSISAQSHSGPSSEEMLKRCQEAETERAALRSELTSVRARLHDSESQRQNYHEQLLAAEKRADRLQSKSLTSSSSAAQEEPNETVSTEPLSSPDPPAVNGNSSLDSDEWKDLAELRETKIEELTRENTELQTQLQTAQLQLRALPDEIVVESSQYKVLQERTSLLEHTAKESQAEATKLKEQLDNLMTARSDLEAGLKAANETALNELQQALNKRDSELLRMRTRNDQVSAEINERREKEKARLSTAAEFKTLAEARGERIAILESETQRLKARLTANAGDEDLMTFIWQNTSEDLSYVDDLRRRLSNAEERVEALQKTLAGRGDAAKSEAEVRRQLAHVQKQLDKYQAVYGDASSMPPETAQLSEQLQRKQDELDKLRLQDKQREQAESAIYSELDKLSAAWEALEKQLKKKVYDLSAMDERISKVQMERAKTDNKFFLCMRDKEAVDNERKRLVQNLDRAAKAIEKLGDAEKNLQSRVATLEKEVVLWKRMAEEQKERGNALEFEVNEWHLRAQGERKNADEMRAASAENIKAMEQKRTELRKLEESLLKTKKDAEKHAAKLKLISASSNSSANEVELQKEVDKCYRLLKCSTCQQNIRNTVLTKCMHTFCRSCIDARIATRQRKCPACNLGFSQGEVTTLFLQ
ncbi:BRE1-domain-containing protein [Polyporus arcularius HHB13444]|uniref:E3 ubiquitin protein ligase n=1 Tax=Polyporus arcularius HHB13444 TaxID=1314778 RepID=A0A5C3PDG5_9APHY|nr:BRE1-domain-containing protein [Polyporus arcularius HHB13444]